MKGGPTLDPFAARLAAADGSVVGGGEGVGAVVQAVQELFAKLSSRTASAKWKRPKRSTNAP